jgi:hypothetical protein
MTLKPDQAIAIVSRSVAIVLFPFMVEDTLKQVAGRADVERAASAGHDICEITSLVHSVDRSKRSAANDVT